MIFLSAFVLNFSGVTRAQNISNSDSLEYRSYLEQFDNAIGIENTGIINGVKYTIPLQTKDSHPFYNSTMGSKASVVYGNQHYFNITVLYDIYADELVVQQTRANGAQALIQLYKENVESFRIYDHTFKNYHGTEAQKLAMASGFYDALYESPVFSVIAKRKKTTHVNSGGVVDYEGEDRYFFIQNDRLTPFRGMRNFHKVLGDKNLISDLKSFAAKNNLKVKKNDSDLISVARYCDSILKKQK